MNAAFGRHAIHGQTQLLINLFTADFSPVRIATAQALLQLMGGGYRLLAPFNGNVHQHTSTTVLRGSAIMFSPQVKIRSMPCGK